MSGASATQAVEAIESNDNYDQSFEEASAIQDNAHSCVIEAVPCDNDEPTTLEHAQMQISTFFKALAKGQETKAPEQWEGLCELVNKLDNKEDVSTFMASFGRACMGVAQSHPDLKEKLPAPAPKAQAKTL